MRWSGAAHFKKRRAAPSWRKMGLCHVNIYGFHGTIVCDDIEFIKCVSWKIKFLVMGDTIGLCTICQYRKQLKCLNQVNLCCLLHVSLRLGTKFTWIVVIKILVLTYHHGHFLAATLDITFFHNSLLGSRILSLQLDCFVLDFTSFCNCMQ